MESTVDDLLKTRSINWKIWRAKNSAAGRGGHGPPFVQCCVPLRAASSPLHVLSRKGR